MPYHVTLALLIDALAWPAAEEYGFMRAECPYRRPLQTVLGYSTAAVPSILTGRHPQEHGRWSYLYYDPLHSPFRWTRCLRWGGPVIHNRLVDNPLLKRVIARLTARAQGYTGYFAIYDFPLRYLHLMGHCSDRWDFAPAAFECPSLVDYCQEHDISAQFLTYPMPEEDIFAGAQEALKPGGPRLLFLYLTAVDALGHAHGPTAPEIGDHLRWYEAHIQGILETARARGVEPHLSIFSDHGMVTVERRVDIQKAIAGLGLRYGEDYVAVYDSTMARFWYLRPEVRPRLEEALAGVPQGRVLSPSEKKRYGIAFAGDKFGETIFLLDSGVVIYPSHMSRRVPTAMHGYDPDDTRNDGVFLASEKPAAAPAAITDIFDVLTADMQGGEGHAFLR